MDEPTPRQAKWYQFSLRAMLLVLVIVAVFLTERGISRRELRTEVSNLRNETKQVGGNSSAPRAIPSDVWKKIETVRKGGIKEATTREEGAKRYLELEAGKLRWRHAIPGETGFFYFQYSGADEGRSPKWEFAPATTGNLLQYAAKPSEIPFRGTRASIRVAVGQAWFARTLDDPGTVYVLYIKNQKMQEEMTVEYVILDSKESTAVGANK
jgi:hypothetical protein